MIMPNQDKWYAIEEALGIKLPIHVLTNTLAGSYAKQTGSYLKEKFGSEFFSHVSIQECGGTNKYLSKELSKLEKYPGYNLLAVVNGGDGTYQKVANLYPNIDRLIGCYIPGGTSNDFPKSLGISGTKDVKRMCNLINKSLDRQLRLEDYVKQIDLMKVQYDENKEVYGFNVFGVGFDALISNEVNDNNQKGGLLKKFRFVKKTVELKIEEKTKPPEMHRFKPLDIGYILNKGNIKTDIEEGVLAFNFLNGKQAASGVYRYKAYALDDGVGQVAITKNMNLERGVIFLIGDRLAYMLERPSPKERICFDGINSVLLNILNYEKKDRVNYYLELDGEHYKIDKPKADIKLEVIPKATSAIYLHEKVAQQEMQHRHIYFPALLEIPDAELRILSELAEKNPYFVARAI